MARRKYRDQVHLMFHGFRSFGKAELAEEFLQMLSSIDEIFQPSKIGMYEPIKTPFSMENFKRMWIESEKKKGYGGILFVGPKFDEFNGHVTWLPDGSNSISLYFAADLVKGDIVEGLINMVKKMFIWSNAVYGFGAHTSQDHYTPGLNYETCICRISWMTLFGPPYVEMFGKDVIQTASCYVEEFAENRFMLLTSNQPMEETPELAMLQERVKKHLGEDAFYRPEPPRKTPLTMEDLIAGKDRPSKEGYRSPDLSAYLKDSGTKKNDAGLILKINDDGTTATYKMKTEKN